jgi:hypothetical protein
MSTAPVKSLIDEQIEELPEHKAVPADRVLMVFKGKTWQDALAQAALASIENVHAWSGRACLCGEWTVAYEVKT